MVTNNTSDQASVAQLQGLNSNFGSLIKTYTNTTITSNTFISQANNIVGSINTISSNVVTLTANVRSISANIVTSTANLASIAANLSGISSTLTTMKNIMANTQVPIYPSTFTMTASANTTTITNGNVLGNSYVFITATNQAAANLFPIYITVNASGGSFTAKTGNNMVAVGTEVFNYLIVN